jgi:hypothetical protein
MSDASLPQGPLPSVHDEAADTPTWLPVTGLVLLLVMVMWMLYRGASPVEETADVPVIDTAGEIEPAGDAPAE